MKISLIKSIPSYFLIDFIFNFIFIFFIDFLNWFLPIF